MKKGIVLGVVFLFVMLSFTSISGIQIDKNIINPSVRGNTLYVGGSGEGNYTRIQDAIDDASNGDTIFVYDDSSPYLENIVVNISLNLFGEEKNTTVIDGNGIGDVVRVNSDNVHITGFTIQNSGEDEFYDAGINIRKTSNHTIQNNIMRNNYYGLVLYLSDYNIILENNFYENIIGLGIVWLSAHNTVKNNKISNNGRIGIYLDGAQYNTIKENIIEKNGFTYPEIFKCGIRLEIHAKYNLIFDNIISNNWNGIIENTGYLNNISKNVILNNAFNGIFLSEYSSDTEIDSNHIKGNGLFGLYLDKSEYTTISNNNFIDNTKNIFFRCYLNEGNNFKWSRNYYDNYKGFGSKIILGFMKSITRYDYGPFDWNLWINFDMNPASEPYDITTPHGCGIE